VLIGSQTETFIIALTFTQHILLDHCFTLTQGQTSTERYDYGRGRGKFKGK